MAPADATTGVGGSNYATELCRPKLLERGPTLVVITMI